jgi:hypothetical protein
MQKMYPRTNIAPFEVSEDSNAKPVPQIEDALREFARENAAHMRHEPENATQVVPDLNSLVRRVADVSMAQLDDVIVNLRQLRDSLHNESERIQREISAYMQLSQTAMGSTKIIADNIVLWKETAHGPARNLEKGRAATERAVAAPAPLAPPSPTAAIDLFIPPK